MINIAVFYDNGDWVTYLFPRAGKHRPEVFHTGELTISPAAIDLCGIVAVPWQRISKKSPAEAVEAIFREVTLPLRSISRSRRTTGEPALNLSVGLVEGGSEIEVELVGGNFVNTSGITLAPGGTTDLLLRSRLLHLTHPRARLPSTT